MNHLIVVSPTIAPIPHPTIECIEYNKSYYDNKIVLIKWSNFYESLCCVQQWTLQLEEYANVIGVLIGNDKDFNRVYALSILLEETLNSLDSIWITFGCFIL